MSARPKTARARVGVAIGALAFAAAALVAVQPASAAPQDIAFAMQSGTLQVGDQSFVLPNDAGFNGTLDDETGALSGSFVFPVIRADVTDPFPVVVFASLVQSGPATGTIDFASGAATLDTTLNIGLEIQTAAGAVLVGGSCGIGPISLTFTGTYDEATETLTLADEGFTLPNSSGCASPGIDFGPIIDDLLGGSTSANLVLSASDGPITTPTTRPNSPTTGSTQPTGPTPTVSAPPAPTVPTPSGPNPPRTAREGQQQVRLTILDQVADEAAVEETVPQVTG